MTDERGGARDDDEARAEALFRNRVIAPLLDEREERSLRERIATLSGERHAHPTRGEIGVSERTLWTWLGKFRAHEIAGLHPRTRSDRGSLRACWDSVLDRAERLRRELPTRWTSTIVDILVREGLVAVSACPDRSTLDRHLRQRGASRRQLAVLGEKRTIKMRFDAFGDLWVGDYHHGPRVLRPDGATTTAKLGAFLDHTTRYPVADRWYLAEDIASLRDTMLRAPRVGAAEGGVCRSRGRVRCRATGIFARGARLAAGALAAVLQPGTRAHRGGSSPTPSRQRSRRARSCVRFTSSIDSGRRFAPFATSRRPTPSSAARPHRRSPRYPLDRLTPASRTSSSSFGPTASCTRRTPPSPSRDVGDLWMNGGRVVKAGEPIADVRELRRTHIGFAFQRRT